MCGAVNDEVTFVVILLFDGLHELVNQNIAYSSVAGKTDYACFSSPRVTKFSLLLFQLPVFTILQVLQPFTRVVGHLALQRSHTCSLKTAHMNG